MSFESFVINKFHIFLSQKQQRLNELLKQQKERNVNKRTPTGDKKFIDVKDVKPVNGEIKSELKREIKPNDSEDDCEEEEEEEEFMSETPEASSDDEKDQDFLFVAANAARLKKKKAVAENKPIVRPAVKVIELKKDTTKKFICDYCDESFKAKQGLTRHVQSHIDVSTPWLCDVCQFAASSKIKLNLHKLETHNIPIPMTKSDRKKVKKIVIEEVVSREKSVESEYSCFCGASFNSPTSLRAHRNRMHGKRNKCVFGCVDVQYVKTGHFLRHVQTKHPDKLEQCIKGTENYITKVNNALKNSSLSSQVIISCDRCDFKTIKKASLKSHMESHLPYAERDKFECELCNKLFTRATSLRVHRATIHEKIRKYACTKCPDKIAFKQLGHLNDHIACKHGKPGKGAFSFKCKLCGRVFLKRYMLNRHQRQHHKIEPQVALTLTPAAFKKMKKIRTFKCFCGLNFPYQSRLLRHQLKHDSGDFELAKTHKCPFAGCRHRFTQRCNLVRHQKQKNHLKPEEEKLIKFKCSCGKKFFSYRGYSFHCDKTTCILKEKGARTRAIK